MQDNFRTPSFVFSAAIDTLLILSDHTVRSPHTNVQSLNIWIGLYLFSPNPLRWPTTGLLDSRIITKCWIWLIKVTQEDNLPSQIGCHATNARTTREKKKHKPQKVERSINKSLWLDRILIYIRRWYLRVAHKCWYTMADEMFVGWWKFFGNYWMETFENCVISMNNNFIKTHKYLKIYLWAIVLSFFYFRFLFSIPLNWHGELCRSLVKLSKLWESKVFSLSQSPSQVFFLRFMVYSLTLLRL